MGGCIKKKLCKVIFKNDVVCCVGVYDHKKIFDVLLSLFFFLLLFSSFFSSSFISVFSFEQNTMHAKSRELNLQFLGFHLLPPRIFNTISVGRLSVLRVSGNQLEQIPAAVGCLVGLTELNCSNNLIAFLPTQMKYLNRLIILRASQNKLVFLPIELQSIRTLREIDLSGNNICELPYNFGNHISLNRLQLGANRLTWLPGSFSNLLSLKSLTLSQNPIAALCLMPSNSEDWENQGAGGASGTPNKNQKPKIKLSEAQDCVDVWRRVIDKWGEITYVNSITKTCIRTLPDVVCLLGRNAVIELRTINISEGAYRVEIPDPDDELFNSGVGVHDDPEMIARVKATKIYRRDMERRRLELKEVCVALLLREKRERGRGGALNTR